MSIPTNPLIYRMVHWQNVEYILRNGLCCREHANYDPGYVEIGHRQLITDRHAYQVKIPDYGNLGEYVPFYFGGHTPMLYLIKNGYKGVTKRAQDEIVFIVSDHDTVKQNGLQYFFTDMNAKRALADHFNNEADFDKLKWNIINDRDWSNSSGIGRQDYKQAEYLVRGHIPITCVKCLVVKTAERKKYFDSIIQQMGMQMDVHIDNKCKLFY